jgi:hypothetical protein
MTQKIARPNSKLYFDLYQQGGDKLIAVYAILKTSRDGLDKYYSYISKNNKTVSGYALLRSKTILTLHSIKKYVPTLISMGLCYIKNNGDVHITGGERLNKQYNCRKIVPIVIGKNIIETALNAISVRAFSMQMQQERQISNKQNRSELLLQVSNPTNYKLYKKAQKLEKRLAGEKIIILDKVVLSNQGYAVLKNGTVDNKSMGQYWKKRLTSKGIVKANRRFYKIKQMSYEDYQRVKTISKNKRIVYSKGFLCEELISSFNGVDLTKSKAVITSIKEVIQAPIRIKQKVKPLQHLSFDMVAWWANS